MIKEILKHIGCFAVFIYIIVLNCQLIDARQESIRKGMKVQDLKRRVTQYQKILEERRPIDVVPYKTKSDDLKQKGELNYEG